VISHLVPYLVLILQLGAGAAFIVAGTVKLVEPVAIRGVIASLGVAWSSGAALVLAAAELVTGLALILLPGNSIT
jgi:uncharacterized membrane protein YphA (DoxX/SURF4 family)